MKSFCYLVIGCLKEGPVIKENESTKAHGFRDNGITLQNKSNNGDSSFPQQNGFARNIDSPTSYIRKYNCHLKDGRYHLILFDISYCGCLQ